MFYINKSLKCYSPKSLKNIILQNSEIFLKKMLTSLDNIKKDI